MARGAIQQFRVAAQETVEETRKSLIATAKREHARVMGAEPKPQGFLRSVDGRRGAPEEAVKPDGVIIYDYQRLGEIVEAAIAQLVALSPVLSGAYRNAHTIFANGVAVSSLADWDGQGEIVIANAVPYARKIELGKMRMRVPGTDHVYEQAEFLLSRRFGNQARIRFTYRGLAGGAIAQGKAHGRSELRYPALVITER